MWRLDPADPGLIPSDPGQMWRLDPADPVESGAAPWPLVHCLMAQVSIAHLRHLIRTLNYVVSTHAADELEDDNLSILDLENIVLTGQIVERQRDRQTRETKYVVQGVTLEGAVAEVVSKISAGGKLFIITVYLC
jgi:hypothetical protein